MPRTSKWPLRAVRASSYVALVSSRRRVARMSSAQSAIAYSKVLTCLYSVLVLMPGAML